MASLAVTLGGRRGPQVGSLSAHIPGDYRYADELAVFLNEDGQVVVEVDCTGAVGGMDSFDGASEPRVDYRAVLSADSTPAQVVAAVKRAMGARSHFLFQRYGKATKNFCWGSRDRRGLSAKLAGESLAEARAMLAASRRKAALPDCDGCGRKIPEQDVRNFQREGGTTGLPACCEDCAETDVRDSRIGGGA